MLYSKVLPSAILQCQTAFSSGATLPSKHQVSENLSTTLFFNIAVIGRELRCDEGIWFNACQFKHLVFDKSRSHQWSLARHPTSMCMSCPRSHRPWFMPLYDRIVLWNAEVVCWRMSCTILDETSRRTVIVRCPVAMWYKFIYQLSAALYLHEMYLGIP
ncbi:hypothetical protein K456DRAFT_478862 [Colletotrichum gloeosporioides 23]|nr:hypothetical protein K456DRAFT_478862 [Colletotrichum gloeosporioides 23]